MGFFSRKPDSQVSREQMLAARPVRHPLVEAVRAENGEISLKLPRRKVWWLNLLARLGTVPEYHTLTLDKVGSRVWDLCDGQRSVKDLAAILSDEQKIPSAQAETSMIAYLSSLSQRGLVGMAAGSGGAPGP